MAYIPEIIGDGLTPPGVRVDGTVIASSIYGWATSVTDAPALFEPGVLNRVSFDTLGATSGGVTLAAGGLGLQPPAAGAYLAIASAYDWDGDFPSNGFSTRVNAYPVSGPFAGLIARLVMRFQGPNGAQDPSFFIAVVTVTDALEVISLDGAIAGGGAASHVGGDLAILRIT